MDRNLLFVVPSTIHISTNPLSYAAVRSAFSSDERAEQTLQTITSIRNRVPGAKILLIETGSQHHLPYNIEALVDKYLYLGNRSLVRNVTDGPYKGLGEVVSLYLAHRWILSFGADYYFKLSGRYHLNEQFLTANWSSDSYTGKAYFERRMSGTYTVLYGFPARLYANWRASLRGCIPTLQQGQSVELIQPHLWQKPVQHLSTLGVSGWISPSGLPISL